MPWQNQSKNSSSYIKQAKKEAIYARQEPSETHAKFDIGRFDKAKFDAPSGTFWKKQKKN